MPAYCFKLDRIPGLSALTISKLRRYISKNKDSGIYNVPRGFNREEAAVAGEVSVLLL